MSASRKQIMAAIGEARLALQRAPAADPIVETAPETAKKPEAPCVSCANAARCESQMLACEQLRLYAIYHKRHTAERWKLAPRFPSKQIAERIRAAFESSSF
jgi:hypothetical protein